ncbi:hypothetical protein EV356DRAFT_309157 [Viridothelium virens]|uniref:Mitotic apparatus protein p62 n=1 Tax=Viridothelium virens TaxID=1048519 RepID=A0A6A6HLU3_VIRVR|nr:hypothetical protein EV356DRAFT_309157 [Viridothelium virens]
MDQQTLRIPRADVAESFVLAHVTRTGSSPLDVKIEATEGESPYIGHLEESTNNLGEPTKSYRGSAGEWKTVLAHGLSLQGTDPQERKVTGGLETVAQIEPGKMTIVFRQNIAGITQRIGTITLSQDDDLELSIFDWAGQAASTCITAQREISSLKSKFAEQQNMVDKLQAQLDDLIKSKEEHEEALLNKFQKLLNSKKLKIRDQQRLLAGARVDLDAAAQIQQSRSADYQRKPTASRKGKRGAAAVDEEMEHEGNGEGSDQGGTPEDDDRGDTATPNRSDVDTTEEEDEERAKGFTFMPSSADTHAQMRGPEAESKATEVSSKETSQRLEVPPPRRPLPFQKRAAQKEPDRAQKRGASQGLDDEDTTDDEL